VFFRPPAAGRPRLLSCERTPGETTWSAGERVDSALVARAFGLDDTQAARLRPADEGPRGGMLTWPVLLLILVVVLVMLAMCSHDECGKTERAFGRDSTEYRACRNRVAAGTGAYWGSGSSWGGYSSGGGGHK
jgi:hypothetical protein